MRTFNSPTVVSRMYRRTKPLTHSPNLADDAQSNKQEATENESKAHTMIKTTINPLPQTHPPPPSSIGASAPTNDHNELEYQKNQTRKSKRNSSNFTSSLRRFIQVTIGSRSSDTIINTNGASVESNNINTNKPDSQSITKSGSSSGTNQLSCDTSSLNAKPEQSSTNKKLSKTFEECPLCVVQFPQRDMVHGASCFHFVCKDCMKKYITHSINHSRLSISCPVCPLQIHPNRIKEILGNDKELYAKYENFMLRRVIAAEPDARWCPAPDCGYVVIASGCASCPKLYCRREGCNTTFCYHCKQDWHPDETCSAASIRRGRNRHLSFSIGDLTEEADSESAYKTPHTFPGALACDDIRKCPVCGSRVIKMNDGSCNHMTCSICETEFCWLCMKEITDLHYFSPSGCTFWGKKPWSRKKKILWQLGMLVGAPVCIILIAGVAIPAIVIGIPVWAGRKLRDRLERQPLSKYRKNAIVTGGVLVSLIISPLISAVALAVGVPILLGYVYGVVPISLCRSGGCGLSATESFDNLQQATVKAVNKSQEYSKAKSNGKKKHMNQSVGDISLETNSTNEDGHSTRALAGSIYKESDYTLAEIHNK